MLAVVLLFPSAAPVVLVLVALGLTFSIASVVGRQLRSYRAGEIQRKTFILNCVVEITGVVLIFGSSILLGRAAMVYVLGQIPGPWGFVLGLLAAMACGLTMSMLVRSTWGRLVKNPTP